VARFRLILGGGVFAALAAMLLASFPAPAAADVSDPPGACVVTATWGGSGATVDSASTNPGEVIDVPQTKEVTWSARVNGPTEGTVRSVAGSVSLVLPAPFGTVTLGRWSGVTGKIATSGTANLPGLVPAGVAFQIRMEHYENGVLFCTASVQLRTSGGPSPIAWGCLALTALFGALMAVVRWKGRCSFFMRMLTAGMGLVGGALAGTDLVLFGLQPLNSIAIVLLAAAGFITGSFLCKLRRVRIRRKKKDDEADKDETLQRPLVESP
jgi:hypothetical protein